MIPCPEAGCKPGSSNGTHAPSSLAGKAANGAAGGPDYGYFLDHEVLPRLTPGAVFTHPAHNFQKAGDKWRGGCPWHESRSGTAFYLDVPTLRWRCPACDVGGGPVQYLHRLRGGAGPSPRGRAFVDLLRELAALAGVEFPERHLPAEAAERARQREARRAVLADVTAEARARLRSAEGEEARAYLLDRGFDDAAAEALGLGLYPDDLDALRRRLAELGHDAEDVRRSAAVSAGMRGYICIPWDDDGGAPLTLYGRYPGEPPVGQPKTRALRNPKEGGHDLERTKRSPLYLDRALRAGHLELVLVEGVFDAALAQARGDPRVIACVAAELSGEQVKTLARRRVRSVTICLDPDSAGDSGVRSCVRQLHAAGIDAYVAPRLPDGTDPDEFILAHGVDAWKEHTARRVHGFRHETRALLAAAGARPEGDDTWGDRLIAQALAFARAVPEARREELARHFFPEIAVAAGAGVEALLRQLWGAGGPAAPGGGGGEPPPANPEGGKTEAAAPDSMAGILLAHLRNEYAPNHRREDGSIWSMTRGRAVSLREAREGPDTPLLLRLMGATDCPKDPKTGEASRAGTLRVWRQHLDVAWADLRRQLPDEPDVGELDPAAEEELRGLLSRLMGTERPFGRESDEAPPQRRSLLDWCLLWAKPGRWGQVRSLWLWCRLEGREGLPPPPAKGASDREKEAWRERIDAERRRRLRVALRVELAGQVLPGALPGWHQRRLTELCELYGLGHQVRFGHDRARGVELSRDCLADLLGAPVEEEAGDAD